MTVFLTGGTGFIGSAVARSLRERGTPVKALVKPGHDGHFLSRLGCQVVVGDVRDRSLIKEEVSGCSSVIHGAAVYRVGIPRAERSEMYGSNVTGTENVLSACVDAGVEKVVYLSSVIVFGNTRGSIVTEDHVQREPHPSYYGMTKRVAHELALGYTARGLPCVIVQPSVTYGPGDHSHVGHLIRRFVRGKLPFVPFPEAGFDFVHRDDVARGVIQALDRGRPGHQYVLGGQRATAGELVDTLAHVLGRKPPARRIRSASAWLIKAAAPFGSIVGPLVGLPPNLRELVASMDGMTVWTDHSKARDELGYTHRCLEQGLRDTLGALKTATG